MLIYIDIDLYINNWFIYWFIYWYRWGEIARCIGRFRTMDGAILPNLLFFVHKKFTILRLILVISPHFRLKNLTHYIQI